MYVGTCVGVFIDIFINTGKQHVIRSMAFPFPAWPPGESQLTGSRQEPQDAPGHFRVDKKWGVGAGIMGDSPKHVSNIHKTFSTKRALPQTRSGQPSRPDPLLQPPMHDPGPPRRGSVAKRGGATRLLRRSGRESRRNTAK